MQGAVPTEADEFQGGQGGIVLECLSLEIYNVHAITAQVIAPKHWKKRILNLK